MGKIRYDAQSQLGTSSFLSVIDLCNNFSQVAWMRNISATAFIILNGHIGMISFSLSWKHPNLIPKTDKCVVT